jgi:CBS domain-containing protein
MRPDIRKILMPLDHDVSQKLSVSAGDRVTKAIEAMLKNDLRSIAVTSGGRVVGMIRLEDALRKVGLQGIWNQNGGRASL